MSSTTPKTTSEQITEYYQKNPLPQHVIDAKAAAHKAAMANKSRGLPSFLTGRTTTPPAPAGRPQFGGPAIRPAPAAPTRRPLFAEEDLIKVNPSQLAPEDSPTNLGGLAREMAAELGND